MSQRVLVTGATGFVGSQIVSSLAAEKYTVDVIVRPKSNVAPYEIINCGRVIISNDIFKESTEWWVDTLQDVDILIHSAWYAEPRKYLHSMKNIDCLLGSLNMLQGFISAGGKKFIGIGTCLEYDLVEEPLQVTSPLNPRSPYASAKASLYLAAREICELNGCDFVWARLFHLFGVGEDKRRLSAYLISQLEQDKWVDLTQGNQIRDFLDVTTAGRIISRLAVSEVCGEVNVCSGKPISVRNFCEAIAGRIGKKHLLRFGKHNIKTTEPPFIVGVPNYPKNYLV